MFCRLFYPKSLPRHFGCRSGAGPSNFGIVIPLFWRRALAEEVVISGLLHVYRQEIWQNTRWVMHFKTRKFGDYIIRPGTNHGSRGIDRLQQCAGTSTFFVVASVYKRLREATACGKWKHKVWWCRQNFPLRKFTPSTAMPPEPGHWLKSSALQIEGQQNY
jgi:hypothetical protein